MLHKPCIALGIPRHVFPGQSVATRPLHIMHACLCSRQTPLLLVSDTPVGIGGYKGVCDLTRTGKCAIRAPLFPPCTPWLGCLHCSYDRRPPSQVELHPWHTTTRPFTPRTSPS